MLSSENHLDKHPNDLTSIKGPKTQTTNTIAYRTYDTYREFTPIVTDSELQNERKSDGPAEQTRIKEGWRVINLKHSKSKKKKGNKNKLVSKLPASNTLRLHNTFDPLAELPVTDNVMVNLQEEVNQPKPSKRNKHHKKLESCHMNKFHNKPSDKMRLKKSHKNIFDITDIDSSAHVQSDTCTLTTAYIENSKENEDEGRVKQNNSKRKKPTLFVTGDSHARDIANLLTSLFTQYNVTSMYYPGAPMLYILDQLEKRKLEFGKNDMIILIGGTNNTDSGYYRNVLKKLGMIIKSCKAEIVLTELPYLYQQPHNGIKFFEIQKCNSELLSLSIKVNAKFLIFNHLLNYKVHYAKDQVHLNLQGKKVVCNYIYSWLEKSHFITKEKTKLEQSHITSSSVVCVDGVYKTKWNVVSQAENKKQKIRVVESDMEDEIDKYYNHESTAFAHCISADTHNKNNMSQGVALVFRKYYGRPSQSNIIQANLAYQQEEGKSAVYSLITKKKFFHKPTICDYDNAFYSLTQDFRNRNLNRLICSPMGCTRDKIQLEHFAANIKNFQKNTGAKIYIIVHDEESTRETRRGLSYSDFVRRLQQLVGSDQPTIANKRQPVNQIQGVTSPPEQFQRTDDNPLDFPQEDDDSHPQFDVISLHSGKMCVSSEVRASLSSPNLNPSLVPILTPGHHSYVDAVKLNSESACCNKFSYYDRDNLTDGSNGNTCGVFKSSPFLGISLKKRLNQ